MSRTEEGRTRKLWRAVALAGAGGSLAAASVLVPAAGAHAAPASACGNAMTGFTRQSAKGYIAGTYCGKDTVAVGTVVGFRADGRCSYVRTYETNGAWEDSPVAGRSGPA